MIDTSCYAKLSAQSGGFVSVSNLVRKLHLSWIDGSIGKPSNSCMAHLQTAFHPSDYWIKGLRQKYR